MADITLISGSTLGGAEYVAEHLAEKLEEAGITTETLHGPLLEDLSARGSGWLSAQPTVPETFRTTFLLSMKHCRNRSPIFLRSALALSVLAVVNMTPFVGLSINSRQNSKIPVQNRQAKH